MSLLHSSHAAPLLAGQDQPIAQAAKIPAANAWLEIDRQAFADNLRTLQKTLQPQTQMCAVMKADAYGAGIDLLMPAILETQTPCVGITSNAEAAIVRQHGFTGRIMRLRAATNEEIIDALPLQIDELLGNYEQAQAMSKLLQQQNQLLNFHLALNSGGIDRNGLDVSDNKGMKQAVAMTHLPHLKPVGIMTHYAVEDENYVRAHLKTFLEQSGTIIKQGKLKREDLILHTANSFTTIKVPEAHLDMVRPGNVIYGDPSIAGLPGYKRVLSAFKTKVTMVNTYPKGSTVGYDQTHTLSRASRLANLPIGYSDGYRRAFSNKAYVLIRGQKAPVLGKISMNTVMVDVTDIPAARMGDEVVLFGHQGNNEVKQEDLQNLTGALLADSYTVWAHSNQRRLKQP
ncbi:alanine racemase [Vitreoscilla massiliensis]|uniref:Alanine racemase n=2 Tax=Vitreoscilla massiliensis TaxID=1689272 RepID=A0ABY4E1S3_9NEIS|nr:alanine racemase [Vitreoscilla massiliensis]UOO89315.1 alanine racemase [Vitreoscilla massiliensis]